MSRKALGRGLSSLIREVESTPVTGLDMIPVEAIDPNPLQPRQTFPEENLRALADSIRRDRRQVTSTLTDASNRR